MLTENLQTFKLLQTFQKLQESPNSSCEFAGLHFFEVEKLGKSSGIVQFLKLFLEEET